MRKRCLKTIYEMAKLNENIVFIGSDLGQGTLDEFKNEMPGRFFMEGISEQHIISMATGLAMEGKEVFVNTIATFITRRCFEQNIIDLGMTKAKVRLIGNGGGLVYAPLGPTHLAFEDIAIMRTIPNMTIIVCSDADEMERAIKASIDYPGPIYFRIAKGGDPIVSKEELGFKIGKPIIFKNPAEVTLISCGVMVDRALKVSAHFEKLGVNVGVLNCHTLKPLDEDFILNSILSSKIVMTLEEHSVIGGLGSIVSDLIAEKCYHHKVVFKKMALPDVFPEKYGSQNLLIDFYKIGENNIIKELEKLLAMIN
ncbi:hypothetical protein OAK75_00055 [Bacteriovoracales bacterium]|nr:hypothetical protein [Bacteriovoracales bacterium]